MKLQFSTKFLQQKHQNSCGVLASIFSTKTQTKVSIFSTKTEIETQSSSSKLLYDRIQVIGDLKTSVVPVLDQWVSEGRSIDRGQLRNLVEIMKNLRRFNHALEISQWMTDRHNFALSPKGLFEKAESAVNKALEGKKPQASLWNVLAVGYEKDNQMPKAVEMLKRAISVGKQGWSPNSVTLDSCLDYLEGQEDVDGVKDMIRLLKKSGPLTRDIYHRWLRTCVAAGDSVYEVVDQSKMDGFSVDEETDKILKTGQSL
ncbi:hypothetical protein Dsin_031437 [Dipteronia sinensis]|uniref:Pentatricopeptide repeat-containing protein n=1 Tax=Dipteronia sinensis TaxID=43782 RepID=A0AAD9ZLD4_9ROSI|nr:hypothetical protein Dsin_031437 [Dipteronia sinensis]